MGWAAAQTGELEMPKEEQSFTIRERIRNFAQRKRGEASSSKTPTSPPPKERQVV
jgi:hypothetical protein